MRGKWQCRPSGQGEDPGRGKQQAKPCRVKCHLKLAVKDEYDGMFQELQGTGREDEARRCQAHMWRLPENVPFTG